jgi:outer membrane protein OmpA-like peptidoglycan-associated protein
MKRIVLLVCSCALLAGCGPKSTFVLMPNPDGSVGELTITNESGTQVLTEAQQSVSVTGTSGTADDPRTMDEAEIQSIFGKVIQIQPLPPTKFLLYFFFDSTRMHKKSQQKLPLIVSTAKERETMDISVNGHTDRAGDAKYNYQLSVKRAKRVEKALLKAGINAEYISTTSHGEGNPLIPTKDNVAEPKNRRVEVIVR